MRFWASVMVGKNKMQPTQSSTLPVVDRPALSQTVVVVDGIQFVYPCFARCVRAVRTLYRALVVEYQSPARPEAERGGE